MPLQWKIYYWCCIYCLLWNVGMAVTIITPGNVLHWIDAFIVTMLMIAVITIKAVVGLRFIKHYKNKTIYNHDERYVYSGCFWLIIIIVVLLGMAIYGYLLNGDGADGADIARLAATILFLLATIYLIILDRPLKKAVKNRHDNFINNPAEDTLNQP